MLLFGWLHVRNAELQPVTGRYVYFTPQIRYKYIFSTNKYIFSTSLRLRSN